MSLARIVSATAEHLLVAAQRIREGKLVAFPTETVYGLGAACSSEAAVLSIFAAKGRPLTDPVIAHVHNTDSAFSLVEFENDAQKSVFSCLANAFWPGPLTLVCRSNVKTVPMVVTANSGWVGVRCPRHPVALKFLELCGGAVCAPSANRFGHVSPTTAQHVFDDLSHADVFILDGGPTEIGIESTVLKLDFERQRLVVLRRGGITEQDIRLVVEARMDLFEGYEMVVVDKTVAVDVVVGQEAPGQMLTHYAPDVPSLLTRILGNGIDGISLQNDANSKSTVSHMLRDAIVIDFADLLLPLRDSVKHYRTLSAKGDPREAAKTLFDTLRWTESVAQNGSVVLIADMGITKVENETAAVMDRVFRACSGKRAVVDLKHHTVYELQRI